MTDRPTPLEILGGRIREVRLKSNFSQTDLARLLGVAKQTISQWELGRSPPMITNLIKFSAVMGVDIKDLLSELSDDLSPLDSVFKRLSAASQLLPLFGSEEKGGQAIMDGLTPSTEVDEYVSTSSMHQPGDIAFFITSRANEPRFCVRDIVKLRARERPEPGNFVLASVGGKIVFRRWLPKHEGTNSGAILKAENPAYPDIEMTDDDCVLGVMSEHTSFNRS